MLSQVSTRLLKVHPKNQEYYSDLPEEKYQEVKKSIETHGIRDPLKILPDYMIVAGHQRLRIAQELKIEKVPVIVLDITPEEAEYLLIADNEERRQDDGDPVKKAKRAKFLKEYWGVKHGGDRGNQYAGKISEVAKGENRPLPNTDIPKTLQGIAEAFGESERTLKELLKLNDLIEPLQKLVSQKKLGRTAAYSLAFLTSEEQESLLQTLGESGICDLSVAEAKELRQELEQERQNAEELQSQLADLEEERQELSRQISKMEEVLDNAKTEVASTIQQQLEEKHSRITNALKANIENLKEKLRKSQEKQKAAKDQGDVIKQLQGKIAELESQLEAVEETPTTELQLEVEALKREKEQLDKEINRARSAVTFSNFARNIFKVLEKKEDEFDELLRETELNGVHLSEAQRWVSLLERYIQRMKEAMDTFQVEDYIVAEEVTISE